MYLSPRQEKLKELKKLKKLWWQKYKAAAQFRFFAPCYMEQFRSIKLEWSLLLAREEYLNRMVK